MRDQLAEADDVETAMLCLRQWQFYRRFLHDMAAVPAGAAESLAQLADDMEENAEEVDGLDPAFLHGMRQLGMFDDTEL